MAAAAFPITRVRKVVKVGVVVVVVVVVVVRKTTTLLFPPCRRRPSQSVTIHGEGAGRQLKDAMDGVHSTNATPKSFSSPHVVVALDGEVAAMEELNKATALFSRRRLLLPGGLNSFFCRTTTVVVVFGQKKSRLCRGGSMMRSTT